MVRGLSDQCPLLEVFNWAKYRYKVLTFNILLYTLRNLMVRKRNGFQVSILLSSQFVIYCDSRITFLNLSTSSTYIFVLYT